MYAYYLFAAQADQFASSLSLFFTQAARPARCWPLPVSLSLSLFSAQDALSLLCIHLSSLSHAKKISTFV